MGSTVKFRFTEKFVDSILLSTEGNMPVYRLLIPGLIESYCLSEAIVLGLREGDSVVLAQEIDSMLRKKILLRLPHGFQMKDRIYTELSVLRVFRVISSIRAVWIAW